MSRSNRAPVNTQGYGSKGRAILKRSANKTVRKTEEVGNGTTYKKQYNPWDICDFKIYNKNSKKAGRK